MCRKSFYNCHLGKSMSRRKGIPVDKKPKEMFSCHASFHTEANQAIKSRVHEYQTGYYRSLSIPFYEIPLASDFGIYAYVCGCKNPNNRRTAVRYYMGKAFRECLRTETTI